MKENASRSLRAGASCADYGFAALYVNGAERKRANPLAGRNAGPESLFLVQLAAPRR